MSKGLSKLPTGFQRQLTGIEILDDVDHPRYNVATGEMRK
jgi:hypothetical protein